MTTAWPRVKSWLVQTVPTLPGLSDVTVFNGPPSSRSAPVNYVAVGFVEDDNGGTYQKAPAFDGTVWSEVGEVRSRITAQSGEADGSGAEARAFAIVDAIDAAVHADWTLDGVLSPDADIHTSVDVLSISNGRGTATELVLVLTYSTNY